MKRVWQVEATVPAGAGNYGGNNLTVDVIAYTLGRHWRGWRPSWHRDASDQFSIGGWLWFTVSTQRQIRRG
jgi:hypothetical protein